MTHTMTRETLSAHYKTIRERLGDPRMVKPTIPIDRIRPIQSDQSIGSDQSDQSIGSARLSVVRRPPPAPEPLPPPKPTARAYVKILHDVATRHAMTPDDIIGKCRSPRYVAARQEAFYLLRATGYSMLQIGRFCNRDHTTVLHGANKHEAMLNGTTYTRNVKGGQTS